MQVPTIKLTDGKQVIIVNESDAEEWNERGFKPVKEDNKKNK